MTTTDAWIPERPVDEVRYAMQARGGAVAMHGTGDGGVEHFLIQPKALIEELRTELRGATDPQHRRIIETELRQRESAHEQWIASAGHQAKTDAGVRWAHEDPKVLAYFRRIGTATSTVDRSTARDELQEYLHGPGQHLEIDVDAFAAAHLARVDRTAWTSGMDAARTEPQWQVDDRLHTDYARYAELIDRAAHGENEVDRGHFARSAAELREYWAMTAPEEWEQVSQLHQQWQTDPERTRADVVAYRIQHSRSERHMDWAQKQFDPQVREFEAWQAMHGHEADLWAEALTATSEEQAEAVRARITAMQDREGWPESWHSFEQEATEDSAFWREMSERTGERCEEILAEREGRAPRPANAFAIAAEAERDGIDR